MSNLKPRIVSTILASILACAAADGLEPTECSDGCEPQTGSICFFQGQYHIDMKLKIGFTL